MYNEDIKRRFIEEYRESKSAKSVAFKMLSISSDIEEIEQKDVYFIDYDTLIKKILERSNALSYSTFYDYVSVFKYYKQWCMINGYFSDSNYYPIYNITELDLKNIYNNYISDSVFRTSADLHKQIDKVFEIDLNRDTLQKHDCIKLYLLLLYCGIHENDIFTLSKNNVKIQPDGAYIIYREKIVKIEDDETRKLIIKRMNCSAYEIDRGRWTEYADIPDLLITYGSGDSEHNQRQTKNELPRVLKSYNDNNNKQVKIQPFNIYTSGLINQIKKNGEEISAKQLYKIFEENGYPEDIATRGKKKIIKETYKVW